MQILVVEDDPVVRSFLDEYLAGQGYRIFAVEAGEAMFEILADQAIDLIVLDLTLPGEDGLELTTRIRANSDLPIIMVTAKGDSVDRIVGLEIGADDYLAKPFEPRELLARVRSVLRRAHRPPVPAPGDRERAASVARFAGWQLDLRRRQLISARNDDVRLTSAEFQLLSAFLGHPDRVLSRDRLIDLTLSREMFPFERTVDSLVARLRRKIENNRREPDLIKTVRGAGYIFTPVVEWS